MDIKELSGKYVVKKLGDDDIPDIFDLCSENKLYYEYCPPMVTEESIKKDLLAYEYDNTEQGHRFGNYFRTM